MPAGYLEHSYPIHNLDNGASGSSWHFSLLLVTDPIPIALTALLRMSTLSSEWHMNCMLQFLREHQPNAVEAAPDLEVVQNPLAKSQGVPDQQAMDALMLEVVVALPCRRSPRLALPMCGRCVLGRRSDALSGKCSCAPNGPPLLACVRSFLVWVAGWNTSTPRTWPPRCSSTTRSSSPLQEGSKDVRS